MKRFEELNADQKGDAVEYALSELRDCIEKGLIHFEKRVSDSTLLGYAEAAAENALYAEEQDKIVYGIVQSVSYEA